MIRIGIIGTGGIAQRHVEGLQHIENATIVAVADVVEAKAKTTAAKCGAKWTTDYATFLDAVDAVYICTPPSLHKDQVITAAEAGKHILCEKPIATSYEDGLAITRAVAANGVRMTMGFNMRFRSPFRKLKEIYAAGTVGQAISYWTTRMGPGNPTGENWRTTPGLLCGITIESVSHDIDLLRWICGEVTSVHGQIRNATTIDGYNDNMCAVMSLANGAMANFHVSWASAIGFNSRGIIGTEGAVSVDGDGIWKLSRIRLKTASSASEAVTEISADEATNMAYQEEGQHFVDCLESGEAFLVTEQDGLAALKVSLGIHKSSETGCVVSLSE